MSPASALSTFAFHPRRAWAYGVFVALIGVAAACHYAGPLASGGSSIREGTLPDRPARFLAEAGGALSPDRILPATASDSAAVYLLVIDQRALGIPSAQVAVLAHSYNTPDLPKNGWEHVDAHGLFTRRFGPGEYVVFVKDEFHWPTRRIVRLSAGSIDTLLAVMRNAAANGSTDLSRFPP